MPGPPTRTHRKGLLRAARKGKKQGNTNVRRAACARQRCAGAEHYLGGEAHVGELPGQRVAVALGMAIDDAGARWRLVRDEDRHVLQHRRVRTDQLLVPDLVSNVWPIEALQENLVDLERENVDHVFFYLFCRSGGQSHPRDAAEARVNHAESAKARTELMPPFADAMRFVDCKEVEEPFFVEFVQTGLKVCGA
eukprot:2640918-Rhodomonas_salina.2